MLGVIGSLAGLIKVRASSTKVDDSVFRLYYRWTTTICFIACGLVATSDIVGEPIQCLMGSEEAPKPITTYCWINSIFTINTTHITNLDYHGVRHGLGNYNPAKHEMRVHAYYQWVPFVLFFLGCMFYLPHLLWKEMEGKRVESMLQGLNVISFDEANPAKKENLINYLFMSRNMLNGRYAYGYMLMQLFNLTIVLSTGSFLDSFFGNIFMDYGTQVLSFIHGTDDAEISPMMIAFPTQGKCTFRQYGPSGSLESHDALCLVPQNIMNQKIFLVLWFWLIILTPITCINIIYLAVQFISPTMRLKCLEHYGKMVSSRELENFLHTISLGDYFLLTHLANNLDAITFRDVLTGLINKKSRDDASNANTLEQPARLFSPHAPSYKHFNIDDEEDPTDYKRRMEAGNSAPAPIDAPNGRGIYPTVDTRV